MILFFDLDGPLLDVSNRYVVLHQELLRELGWDAMPAHRYWACKRGHMTEEAILAELGAASIFPVYGPRRLELIETAAYLRHDRCWPWTLAVLEHVNRHADLVMVTARSDRAALLDQLGKIGIRPFFREILSEQGGESVDRQKAALIKGYLERERQAPKGHWMIGDTEADVLAGKHVGLSTVAVLSGIRNEDQLRRANPDFLVPDIRDVPAMLELPPLAREKAAMGAGVP
jgi:phosphoglycolate phosphatase